MAFDLYQLLGRNGVAEESDPTSDPSSIVHHRKFSGGYCTQMRDEAGREYKCTFTIGKP